MFECCNEYNPYIVKFCNFPKEVFTIVLERSITYFLPNVPLLRSLKLHFRQLIFIINDYFRFCKNIGEYIMWYYIVVLYNGVHNVFKYICYICLFRYSNILQEIIVISCVLRLPLMGPLSQDKVNQVCQVSRCCIVSLCCVQI